MASSFIKSTAVLAPRSQPYFLGLIKLRRYNQQVNQFEELTLATEDVDAVFCTVFKKYPAIGKESMYPVQGLQNIQIPNSVIHEVKQHDLSAYEGIGSNKKFDVNFTYVPPTQPWFFEMAGTYLVQFVIEAFGKQFYNETEIKVG